MASTGLYQVSFNGVQIQGWSSPWPQTITLTLKPICGCNTLIITVYNYYYPSPSAIIYSLTQSTSGCYNCPNLGVTFYNRDTCSCQCASTSYCQSTAMRWYDYPSCGCKCINQLSDSACSSLKYWNLQTCSCQCHSKCCP
jgi:hypothetical protein